MARGLTIGQAAAFANVTIKTVRHYHRLGLVAEPDRDTSGYRRYGSADLFRLVQVRTLAEAGVPLAEIEDLLDAEPEQFAARMAEVDRRLSERIDALRERQLTLHRLSDGDRALLSDRACSALARFTAYGFGPEFVDSVRESLILLRAITPDLHDGFLDQLDERFADPEHIDLLKRSWQARHWDPHDPRIEALAADLAADLAANLLKQREVLERNAATLVDAKSTQQYVTIEHHGSDDYPALVRINTLVTQHLRAAGVPIPTQG